MSNHKVNAEETAHTQTGNGVADKIRHDLKFDKPVTYDEARAWIKSKNWLGFHPAGYGPDILIKGPGIGMGDRLTGPGDATKCSEWIWEHYASCD